MSQWTEILSPAQLDEHYDRAAALDPVFARKQRAFYESRGDEQLRAIAAGAWQSNSPETYQLARSYLAAPQERRRRLDAAIQQVQERRFRRRPAQELDTSALPLFGDAARQIDLF